MLEEKDLMIRQPDEVSLPRVVAGISGVISQRVKAQLPEVTIVYRAIDENDTARPGQLRLGKKGAFNELDCVFILAHTIRRLTITSGTTRMSVCASSDGLAPLPTLTHPKAKSCNECVFAEWSSTGGKRVPPPCNEGIALLGITAPRGNSDLPPNVAFWFPAYKTAAGEIYSFINDLNMIGNVEALCDVTVNVRSRLVRGQSFSWYVPTLTVTGRTPEKLRSRLIELSREPSGVSYKPYVMAEQSDERQAYDAEAEHVRNGADGDIGDDEVPF